MSRRCSLAIRLTVVPLSCLLFAAGVTATAEEAAGAGSPGSHSTSVRDVPNETYVEGTTPLPPDEEGTATSANEERAGTSRSDGENTDRPRTRALESWRPYIVFGGLTGFDVRFADAINEAGAAEDGEDWVDVDVTPQIGLSARVGLQHDLLAVEASIDAIPHFEVTQGDRDLLDYTQIVIGGTLRVGRQYGRLRPNLIGGGGYGFLIIDADQRGRDWAGGGVLRGGGGLDLYLTETLALSVDAVYVWPTGDLRDSDYVALGWGVRSDF